MSPLPVRWVVAPDWLLLIYTLPSQPSRKRAYVWRELKKLGSVYLRDGVALLPCRPDLEERLAAIAERIIEYEGTVDLIVAPRFPEGRNEGLIVRFNEERASEYREIYHACVRFLRDVLHGVDTEEFGFPDVDNLESELGRLARWYEQVRERDYFEDESGERVADVLRKCETAFDRFVQEASDREGGTAPAAEPLDDVFERLGGSAGDQAGSELPL
jgi:hypothetical protein